MPAQYPFARAQASAAGATVTTAVTIISVPPASSNFRFRDLVNLVITTPNAAASVLTLTDGVATYTFNYPNAATAPSTPFILPFNDIPLQQTGLGNAAWTITASVNASGYNYTAQFVER